MPLAWRRASRSQTITAKDQEPRSADQEFSVINENELSNKRRFPGTIKIEMRGGGRSHLEEEGVGVSWKRGNGLAGEVAVQLRRPWREGGELFRLRHTLLETAAAFTGYPSSLLYSFIAWNTIPNYAFYLLTIIPYFNNYSVFMVNQMLAMIELRAPFI